MILPPFFLIFPLHIRAKRRSRLSGPSINKTKRSISAPDKQKKTQNIMEKKHNLQENKLRNKKDLLPIT